MGEPINWQNVGQYSLADAGRPMEAAQRSFNGAFDGIANVLKERESINKQNFAVEKANNTASYLDQVAQLGKDPAALQAAMADGSIDRLKAGFGPNIDHNAVRGAAEGLLTQRYAQAKQAVDFNNSMLDEKTAPIMDKFKSATMAGNKELAEQYRNEYTAAGGKHAADLESYMRSTTHENQVWDEQSKGWVRDQSMHEAKLKDMAANQELNRGQLKVAQANAATNARGVDLQQKQLEDTIRQRKEDAYGRVIESLGKARSSQAGSTEGQTLAFDKINETFKGDPESATNARRAYGDILKAKPDISLADALGAVLTQDPNRFYKINSIVRGNTVTRALESAATPESASRNADAEIGRKLLQERANSLRNSIMGTSSSTKASTPTAATKNTAQVDPEYDREPTSAGVAAGVKAFQDAQAAARNAPNVQAPVVVPKSGATVAPRNAEEAAAQASMENFKASVAGQFSNPASVPMSAAEKKVEKERQQRMMEAAMVRARMSAGSNK